tara:strand:- start:466 stop:642 length:177 start_codon:yes stop_codon:yes gene_type:complete
MGRNGPTKVVIDIPRVREILRGRILKTVKKVIKNKNSSGYLTRILNNDFIILINQFSY